MPPALFLPAFSGESRAPARSRAGTTSQVRTCGGLNGTTYRYESPPPGGGRYNRLHFPRQKYRISTATVTAQETG